MRADPVGQCLRPARLGIGVTGGTHYRDEDLRRADLAGAAVDRFDRLAGIVDKHPLAGGVRLSHGRRQPALLSGDYRGCAGADKIIEVFSEFVKSCEGALALGSSET
jgi:hypothetical protein